MTDLPSSLGIEAVECLSEGGRSVTVRVTGRWRRRRPELRGQPMLVVDTVTGRQRFLAMPEPPSLTGAAPGTWRMSFAVPAALAPALPGRTFLQLGGVMVPLPIGQVALAGESAEEPRGDVVEAPPERDSEATVEEPQERDSAVIAEVPQRDSEATVEGPGQRDSELVAEAPRRDSELVAEVPRQRTTGLAEEVERLENELEAARAQAERLRRELAERERRLRAAEQHAHAERALRSDLEQELTRRTRAADHDLSVLHDRVADLERELARVRRAADEASHAAAAAEAARGEAERRLREQVTPSLASPPQARPSRRELELLRAAPPGVPSPAPSLRPVERADDRTALRHEAALADRRAAGAAGAQARVSALERELVAAREEIEAQRRRSTRAYEAIELVRAELRELRAAGPAPPMAAGAETEPDAVAPGPAEPPQAEPVQAEPDARAPGPAEPPPAEPVQAERLSEALARLRDRTPPLDPALDDPGAAEHPTGPAEHPTGPAEHPTGPAEHAAGPAEHAAPVEPAQVQPPPVARAEPLPATKPWLHSAFRALAAEDPSTAGRMLLALLPAQRAADEQAVAYDLVLSDVLVAHVTVGSAATHVELDPTARPLSEVDFQVVGDLASVARLLRAGPVRRRLPRVSPWRRRARLRGERRRVSALDRLIGARLSARELDAAGVRFDPLLSMRLAAVMIDPAWTAGSRFVIGHRESSSAPPGAYLHVRDGKRPLAAGEPPHGPVDTLLSCPGEALFAVLAGAAAPSEVAGGEIVGEQRPLTLLARWLERAQCG